MASSITLTPLQPFKPAVYSRAWASVPHPTLPLLATTHAKEVTIYSLTTLTKHSALTGGHSRSVRCAAWKPGLPSGKLCLVTGSFDATAGLWRFESEAKDSAEGEQLEVDVTTSSQTKTPSQQAKIRSGDDDDQSEKSDTEDDWEFTLVLEGHENEIKSVSFAPSGQYLATCSRDKTVWIWEDVGGSEGDDEWETVAVLSEHDGDVKAVAWAPDVPGRNKRAKHGGADVLASASYDNTVRIWREDGDGEWVCVAVLEGHEGTVWGLQWEGRARDGEGFPRLMTFSADATVRIWSLVEEEEVEEEGAKEGANPWSGGIPNTMRRGLREDWTCTAVLPAVHTRDIYSASWSGASGMIASTGSDGVIAVYGEGASSEAAEEKEDVAMASPGAEPTTAADVKPASNTWRILGTVANGHGPYEINHVTWCKRFDPGTERKGIEEMLVTTGDDGTVRPWQIT
ncbi:WD40 repeat-like protein [Coniochaeta ligniaria NRRL 30616]|uniref:Probable cytosolic iron-sulfur protein assembly protein 1 n=1 Tax=Coniochaeta ligniaria NRRL 30616 TaxID=1408157 RepID=A0A1J7J3F3_9PEZI|nr:WD40 repeat-like protein [Coniochaeta ligniaria NRRL 30616]